jgi:hypothetical protein
VLIKLHLDRIGEDQEFEIDVDGALMRWRQGGGAWDGDAVVDVFEGSLLETLREALPFTDRHALEAHAILSGFSWSGARAYRFDEALEVFDSITAGDEGKMLKPGRAPAIQLEVRFDPATGPPADHGAFRSSFVPLQYKPTRPQPGQSSTSVNLPPSSSLARFPELAFGGASAEQSSSSPE